MDDSHYNPLIEPILALLTDGQSWKVHTLASQLKAHGHLGRLDEDSMADLAKRNFIIMNALFQLQDELLKSDCYLSISSLHIQLVYGHPKQRPSSNDSLREYYLNWQNYALSREQVIDLLDQFWQALPINTLDDTTLARINKRWKLSQPIQMQALKKRWRTLALAYHPDKNTHSNADFQQIHNEYQQLLQYVRLKNNNCNW